MRTAIVVGAGMAGLTAGYRLKQAGWQVKVVDASDRVGGVARTERINGYTLDTAADGISSAYRTYLQLANELGLGDQIKPSSTVISILRDGKLLDMDVANPLDGIMTPALSLGAKLQLMNGQRLLRKELKTVDGFELVLSSSFDDPDETGMRFADRYFGEEITNYLINPLLRLSTGTATNVSRVNVLSALTVWTARAVNILGGIDRMPRELASHLDVQLGTRVTSLVEENDGVSYICAGDPTVHRADAAVLATPIRAAAEISPAVAIKAGPLLKRLNPCNCITVSLCYTRPTKTPAFFVVVPTKENADVLCINLQHNKISDRVPRGHSALTMWVEHDAFAQYNVLSDDEIIEKLRVTVGQWFPELEGAFHFGLVTRWPGGMNLTEPGYYRDVRRMLDQFAPTDRIQIAGQVFSQPAMETACRWGEFAAKRIAEAGK